MKYLKRTIEPVIKELCSQFAVVAVTGPRQAGKSTTLKKLFGSKYRYFSLDDPEIRALAVKEPKQFIESIGDYCIIDEAQYSPDIFSYVKIMVDSNPSEKGRFILSGSQQFLLMKSITESLAGRVGLVNMSPLSMDEAIRFDKKISGEGCFYTACLRSTYPEPFISRRINVKQWFEAYLQTYVQRDVRSLYNVGKLEEFEAFVKILAGQAGQILNLSSISKGLGVAVNTLKTWISILQASGIIYILYPYHANISKQLTKSPKVYFMDTGLLCYLNKIDSKDELKNSRYKGSVFENYCLIETLKYFRNRNDGGRKHLYFLRDQDRLEIDLLIESGRRLHPVEIKLSDSDIKNAAGKIEKLITGFKALPVDTGIVLMPETDSGNVSSLVKKIGLKDYFKYLESINE